MSSSEAHTRSCDFDVRITGLVPVGEAREGRLLELGPEGARVLSPTPLLDQAQVALDFRLPGYTKEINAIAKVEGTTNDGVRCQFVHIPLFEKRLIENWVSDGDDPQPLAARARIA